MEQKQQPPLSLTQVPEVKKKATKPKSKIVKDKVPSFRIEHGDFVVSFK
jgi:hypothetical protein